MIGVLRGWFWWIVCGSFRPHVWHLVGDWRDGAIVIAGKRGWGRCGNLDYDMTGVSGDIKIECSRCGARGFGHFIKPTARHAWLSNEPRVWSLVARDGRPVAGGPSSEEVEAEIR